ncbi:hypothetical protein OQA88_13448 [Cercophora sp. LCS_1]
MRVLTPTSLPSRPSISLTDPLLDPDSLILVTGANGLIASHITDQLLFAGFRVRGTVRSLSKSSYLTDLYEKRHGSDRFSLVQVSDLAVANAWSEAVRGVSAVAHVLGAVDINVKNPDKVAQEELRWQYNLLEACAQQSSIQSFAFTSSAWAAWTPKAGQKVVLNGDSWNDEALNDAREGKGDGMTGFMALKMLVERGVWEWVEKHKPRFAFNALLVDTVMGECLDPAHQGIPSTAGMVQWVWENKYVDVLDMMQPQWHVNCRDMARVYVAILATGERLDRERVYVFGERYSWYKVAEILKDMYPERADKMARPQDLGWSDAVVERDMGLELLKRVGQSQWTSLETSVDENAKSWLKLEKGGLTSHKYGDFAN